MSGNFDQIGFSDTQAWADYLSGISISDLATAWNVPATTMTAVLTQFAQGAGLDSSWTAAQVSLAKALNPNLT